MHYAIGGLRAKKGDTAGAEDSYLDALRLQPRLSQVHRDLGVLLQKRGDLARAEKSYAKAVRLDPSESNQTESLKWLGVLKGHHGHVDEARAYLQRAVDVRVEAGLSPASLAMNLESLGEEGYLAALQEERLAFRSACEAAAAEGALSRGLASELRSALSRVRAYENSAEWVVSWHLECLSVFNLSGQDAAYGAVWFPSWRAVVASPQVQRALASDAEEAPYYYYYCCCYYYYYYYCYYCFLCYYYYYYYYYYY